MKLAIGTFTLLLIAGSMQAQNPATTLQSTKANVQSGQQQKQVSSSQVSTNDAKTPAQTVKPVAHNAAQATASKPNAVAAKSSAPVHAAAKKASATAHNAVQATQNPKSVAVVAKVPTATPKTVPVAKPSAQVATNNHAVQAPQSATKAVQASVKPVSAKPAQISVKTSPSPAPVKPVPAKAAPVAKEKAAPVVAPAKEAVAAKVDVNAAPKPEGSQKAEAAKTDDSEKKETSKYINITGRHDPFVSPVVSQAESGSGCSVGKKCLAIDQISIRGVVKSDSGMIAVVVNALDKAYFLRENDPVFNGYVEKITEDSIIFKETYQDKLGKPLTRDVTKRVQAPAV